MHGPPSVASALDGAAGAVVILSANPMHDTGGGQRSAQLAAEFLLRHHAVLFVSHGEVTETVDLKLSFGHPRLVERALRDVSSGPGANDIRSFLRHPGALVITQVPVRPWQRVLSWAQRLGAVTVFELIDEWDSELGDGWYRRAVEGAVAARSDILVATAPALQRQLAGRTGRAVSLLPNAFNAGIFRGGDAHERPADLPPGPAAIYVGSLWGGWIDWELVKTTAQALPDVAFVFIGDYRGEGAGLPANCHFLGLKPQRSLPPYLRHATVALLPWTTGPMTQGASPLKVYEYVAMGLRVVSPELEPVKGIPGVVLCPDARSFADAIRAAVRTGLTPEAAQQMAGFAAEQSWSRRVDSLMALVDAARRAPTRRSLLARIRARMPW